MNVIMARLQVVAVCLMATRSTFALKTKSRTGVRVSLLDGHLAQTEHSERRKSDELAADELAEVGTGPGRPLFSLNNPALLDVAPTKNMRTKRCIALVMDRRTHSITVDPNALDPNGIATSCFSNATNTTGWSSLTVRTSQSNKIPLSVKAYGAGLLEAMQTHEAIRTFSKTVTDLLALDVGNFTGKALVERAIKMALVSWEDLAGGDAAVVPLDDIARQAWCALLQMRGIRDGYNILAGQLDIEPISMYELMVLNMHAELPALVEIYGDPDLAEYLKEQLSNFTRESSFLQKGSSRGDAAAKAKQRRGHKEETQWGRWSAHKPHGAALVRRIGPRSTVTDIVSAHAAYGNYGEMHRIHKSYGLHWTNLVHNMTMTSYPGCISSSDDYFITNKGLLLMSTTLHVPKKGPFAQPRTTNDGLPNFLRSLIATRLSIKPRSWARIYGFLSGIAGGKQWVIVDYSKFKKNQPIANETVFMVEALPTLMRTADVSTMLVEPGFFQAHGVPHFKQIRQIYGYPPDAGKLQQEHKTSALLDKGASVNGLDNARTLFQEITPPRLGGQIPVVSRNDIAEDGTEDGCKNAIHNGQPACIPEGNIDAKVTNCCLVSVMSSQARSGPPSNMKHSPFEWVQDAFPGWPREAMPAKWDFPWVNLRKDIVTDPLNPDLTTCESPVYDVD